MSKHSKTHISKRNQRGARRRAVVTTVVIVVLLGVLLVQAIDSIRKGNWAGRENYYGDLVGPALQLVGLGIAVVVLIIVGYRYLFGNPPK